MGIALLAFVDLLTPLQSLANRWMSARRDPSLGGAGLRYVAVRPTCTGRPISPASSGAAKPARPLRVVRVVDGHAKGTHAGRVVISGRMSDVCAELDRLAALEASDMAAFHGGSHRLH
ncbi:hypothetical protein BH10PSE18_BH10PSE18_12480 [soil metagenome]|jgi:hypothetical protein